MFHYHLSLLILFLIRLSTCGTRIMISKMINSYASLYDVTPDWIPFVGPRDGIRGYFDASGGSGHAFKTGPIFARELAEWITKDKVKDDFRQFSFDRIKNNQMFNQSFGGNRV